MRKQQVNLTELFEMFVAETKNLVKKPDGALDFHGGTVVKYSTERYTRLTLTVGRKTVTTTMIPAGYSNK